MTLNCLMAIILCYFTKLSSCGSQLCQTNCLQQKFSPKELVFGNVRLTVIFAESIKNGCVKKRYPLWKGKFDQCCALTWKPCEIVCVSL